MHEILLKISWRKHVVGLVFFAISIFCISTASIFYLFEKNQWKEANTLLRQQKSTNSHAENQLQIFNEYFPQYEDLRSYGFIGNSKRLRWLESLQDVGERYDIPSIDFSLDNARPAIEQKDHYYHPNIKLEVTHMELNMTLVHEGDWYNVLRYLHRDAPGLFSAEKCGLRREGSGREKSFLDRLKGSCNLEWYSVVDVSQDWDS